MIMWLDHLLFGNGHGVRSPYFDNRFYWLSGQLYTFQAGHGAQLHSFQWTHPKAGERRRLGGREYVVFHSQRSWLRVMVAWALVSPPRDLDEMNALLRQVKAELGEMGAEG